MSKKRRIFQMILLVFIFAAIIVLVVPSLRAKAIDLFDQARVQIALLLNPPQEEVFIPQKTALPTFTPPPPTETPIPPTATITPITPEPTATISPTPTPLPQLINLEGVRYMDQHGKWNYCGPANLAMALSYWGWQGDRDDTAAYLKPFDLDLNIMPYEMVNYVVDETDLSIVLRYGGTMELLKRFIAAGYPVLVEKGVYFHETMTGRLSWMGHYQVLTGYDDTTQEIITQDSFVQEGKEKNGKNWREPYNQFMEEWRGFNYVFMIIYPPSRESEVFLLLGEYADSIQSENISLQKSTTEIYSLQGIPQFLAWFNRGGSLVRLQDFYGAADAYDQAFALYPSLSPDLRPWRMMWYQTGPYFAYYYTGRYQDVITLADGTFAFMKERAEKLGAKYWPYIEESWYWRGLAKIAIGDFDGGIADLRQSLEYHPGFIPALEELQRWGVTP